MKTILTYFAFIRMHNCLIAALAVAVGQYLTPVAEKMNLDSLAMAAAFFVCGFGNIINDILDIETDRINHPRRALPSGKIPIGQARATAFLFLVVALALMIMLNIIGSIIVFLAICLVTWYNVKLKHTAYWGNLTVSFLGGLPFILGGTAAGWDGVFALPGPVIPAVFGFLMHFGREIVKDIEDRTGDARIGSRTAPVRSGSMAAMLRVYLLFVLLIAVSLAVYFVGWYNTIYLYITVVFIYVPLIVMMIWLGTNPDRAKCRRVSVLVKLQMLPGIIALVVGKSY